MKVYCIYIPRYTITEVDAIYETQGNYSIARVFMELYNELHEAISDPFSLEIFSLDNSIYFCIAGEDEIMDLLIAGIYSLQPDCEIKEIDDYALQVDEETVIVSAEFRLAKRDVLPIQTYKDFGFNTLSPIISTLSSNEAGHRSLTQVIMRPVRESALLHFSLLMGRMGYRSARRFRPRSWMKKELDSKASERMLEKCASRLYRTNYRVALYTQLPPGADKKMRKDVTMSLRNELKRYENSMKFFNAVNENRFSVKGYEEGLRSFTKFQNRSLIAPYRLSTAEITSLWNVPRLSTVPNTAQVLSKRGSPPRSLPTDPSDSQISFIGHTNYRGQNVPFGIRRYDRRRHFYVLGKSGAGKSCLLQLMVKNDIENGFGCCVLDPHGDLVDDILRLVPRHRIKDVVLFDPSDLQYPPSFNPMSALKPELKMRATIGFLDVFRKVLGSDWSEQMDHVVRYAVLALLDIPGSSILSLRKLLTDDDYREAVISKVSDEQVRRFWQEEFTRHRSEFESGTIVRLLNRLDHLLATDMVRNIVGQPMNLFNFREFMDSRKIVLMKVSKGVLGGENSQLLGSLIIAKVYEAAMSRADIPLESRQDFYFYVDEFQNFATDSFGEILSESRKYRLSLTFANQYLGQLPDTVQKTVFGNVGNILGFRVGGADAAQLALEFKPRFGTEDIMNLADREFYVKMSVDGEVQEAFSGRTLHLQHPLESQHFATECIKSSRTKYCLPLEHAIESLNVSEYGVFERYAEQESEKMA